MVSPTTGLPLKYKEGGENGPYNIKVKDTGMYRRAETILQPEISKYTEWVKHGLQEQIHLSVGSRETNQEK